MPPCSDCRPNKITRKVRAKSFQCAKRFALKVRLRLCRRMRGEATPRRQARTGGEAAQKKRRRSPATPLHLVFGLFLLCAIEVILGGVRNFSKFVERARFRRRKTARRVGPLNVSDFAENAVAARLNFSE